MKVKKRNRLGPDQARAIREDYAEGTAIRTLAKEYRTTENTIQKVLNGRTYPEAGGPGRVEADTQRANGLKRLGAKGKKDQPSPELVSALGPRVAALNGRGRLADLAVEAAEAPDAKHRKFLRDNLLQLAKSLERIALEL